MFYRRIYFQFIVLIACGGLSFNAYSATLTSVVKEHKGELVADAVVFAMLLSGVEQINTSKAGIIDQVDKEFIPYVTPVQVGTKISFPNHDKIRHHVYSFSPAKPILFDKHGVVVLGCNIHDWMKAYVYVLETPFFVKTDENGTGTISDLPPGEYEVQVWHPRIKNSSEGEKQLITIAEGNTKKTEFTITLKREWRPLRAPKSGGGIYR
jgi:plastocyanin